MVSCLTSAPDRLPQAPSHGGGGGNRRRRIEPREALGHLSQSQTPKEIKQIHAQILRHGLSHHPILLAKLLRLYSAHRHLDLASSIFSQLSTPPTLLWNLMIRAHALNTSPRDALLLYNRMISLNFPPDKFTLPFTVTACSRCADIAKGKELHASAIAKGKELHASAVKAGFHDDLFLQNTLIHLYFACRDIVSARQVFDGMRVRSVVSWTSLLSGLVACGELDAARAVFDTMPVRNVVTWTAIIDGCARNGRPDETFHLFKMMQEHNVRPNEYTLVGLLIACTELGSLSLGRWVHDFAHKNGGLERGVFVGTALIDMYSKCGSLEDALKVFDQMPERSLATWNSMITSLGVHGRGTEAIALFQEMERADIRPDRITFVGVLCACVRNRMVEEGCRFFKYMGEHYGIVAGYEHYSCFVELLGCDGGLENAREMVKKLAVELDLESRTMLIAASRAHGNIELEEVFCSCIHHVEMPKGREWEVG